MKTTQSPMSDSASEISGPNSLIVSGLSDVDICSYLCHWGTCCF